MTSITHTGYRTTPRSGARPTGVLAGFLAFFARWAAVSREFAEAGSDEHLSPRARRLLRAGY